VIIILFSQLFYTLYTGWGGEMPLYEYECSKCKHIFEKLLFRDDRDELDCPKCGGKARKILSISAFKVKGYSAENGYSKK